MIIIHFFFQNGLEKCLAEHDKLQDVPVAIQPTVEKEDDEDYTEKMRTAPPTSKGADHAGAPCPGNAR